MALIDWTKRLGMDDRFTQRYLNEGFSGGEKKRNEILQMALLEPDLAVLDETDSGPRHRRAPGRRRGHHQGARGASRARHPAHHPLPPHPRPPDPDRVHILVDGRIVDTGGPELAALLDREGFDAFRDKAGATP